MVLIRCVSHSSSSAPDPTAAGTPGRNSPSARRRAARRSRRPVTARGPSPPRSTGRRSPGLGLLREEGRGSLEDLPLLAEPGVLSSQLAQLLALVRGQALALAAVDL